MKGKSEIAGKSRTRAAASAAHPCAVADGKASMRRAAALTPAEEAAGREFRAWMAKYGPVERAVHAERERRDPLNLPIWPCW